MSKIKTTIGNRLKEIMNERNLKQVDILRMSKPYQKKYGIKLRKNNLSQYVNDKNTPEDDKIFLLAQTLGVNEAWLMGFDVSKKPVNKNILSNDSEIVSDIVMIPVLGEIACGDPITAEENIEEYRERPANNLPHGDLFYLKAHGDSMEPKIPDESYVLIREQSDVENGEIAAVLVNGDTEATLKKIRKLNDVVLLEALNDAYEPYVISKDNPAHILGKAVEVSFKL